MPRRNNSETNREETFNIELARMLRDRGIKARAERRSRQGVPDVRVALRTGDDVILECKYAGSLSDLESQLDARLISFSKHLGVLGVVYPDRFRQASDVASCLEDADDIQWWLHGVRGDLAGNRRVRSGSIVDLADHLRVLQLDIEGFDRVQVAAMVVGYAVEDSAKVIAGHARIAQRISAIIAKSDSERDRDAALRIGSLVLFNALAFQERLAVVDANVATVNEALIGGLDGLSDAWSQIMDEVDYVPVFELAGFIVDVLKDAPNDFHLPVIEPLVQAVRDTWTLEGHDLSGRLFHTLLSDAKFTGAYYTSVPAATMLSRLVFHNWPAGVNWSAHEFPASLNIADLACGTGTLLMAVAAEVERKHRDAGGSESAALHKAMVEQALHGYDVQLSAIHFAATSLAMLNPSIQFDRMNLYVMPLGVNGDQSLLGSLEFLNTDEAAVQFALSDPDFGTTLRDAGAGFGGGTRGATEGVTATLPNLDLAIMNPPFTRSVGGNLLFGSLQQSERRKLQSELSRRLKSMQATSTAGLGAAFVAAASPKLRPGEGRLALVLPVTVCTGPSWSQTRALIENGYTLDVVVTSHDPDRWNFSDSTDLSEALLIATRRPENGNGVDHRTTFVNLWQNPKGIVDANLVADAVNMTQPAHVEDTGSALLGVGGEHVGEVFSIPESKLKGKQWIGVQFARADVVRSALRLLNNGEVWIPGETSTGNVPMCRVDDIAEIGPDQRRLVDGFERTSSLTAYPMVTGHDTEERKSLICESDTYLSPLARPKGNQRLGYGERLWQQSSRFLISERLWLETARVVAMRSEDRVLSNVWWPVRVEDEITEKALTVWMNSSLGILALLGIRTTTRGPWVKFKKAELRILPVLDPRQITTSQLSGMSNLFDELVDAEFDPFQGMAQCPARTALDDGISDILGLPDLHRLRVLLASEPVVCNRGL
ncbi:MAG: hypothetical protein F4180_03000 [Chloroflexi bacterium]|nr:hypothetical protein [Chloroflexota bacterium]